MATVYEFAPKGIYRHKCNHCIYGEIYNYLIWQLAHLQKEHSQLVSADAIITSRSSLSHVAGMFSDGEVYYIPFWHPPRRL